MKKILMIGLLLIGLFLIVGCTQQTAEEQAVEDEFNDLVEDAEKTALTGKAASSYSGTDACWKHLSKATALIKDLKNDLAACNAAKPNFYAINALAQNSAGLDISKAHLRINGESADINEGETYEFSNGINVKVESTLVQTSAGGLWGVNFTIAEICNKEYEISALSWNAGDDDYAYFVFNNEKSDNLDEGGSHTLSDGTKITFLSHLQQAYAGGLGGPTFELIC